VPARALPTGEAPAPRPLAGGRRALAPPTWPAGGLPLATALALALALAPAPARADPLPTNHYTIDLYQGPILAPIRVTGLAGAYAGYAEGIEGMVANAAAPAVRAPFSVKELDLDVSGSVSLPLVIGRRNDWDNDRLVDASYSDFVYLTGGAIVQVGALGFGANAELQRYTLTAPDGARTPVTVGKYHALAAVGFFGDQLAVGAGARFATLGIDAPDATITIAGVSPEVGVLWRPDWRSFRIGGTFRFPVSAAGLLGSARTIDEKGLERAGGLVVPDRVALPWEAELGLAVQIGPRPLNPSWIDPQTQERAALAARAADRARARRERAKSRADTLAAIADPALRVQRAAALDAEEAREERAERAIDDAIRERLEDERRARFASWPRAHLLLTAELLVTGPTAAGVSIERFLAQNQAAERDGPSLIGASGASVNFSPRFGVETEPLPGRLHTRFGSYYEPSRLVVPVGRQHFTFGSDLRVLSTRWWGLVPETWYTVQASVDLAPRYQSLSLGIGVWH
jgi:hypothetical protein